MPTKSSVQRLASQDRRTSPRREADTKPTHPSQD